MPKTTVNIAQAAVTNRRKSGFTLFELIIVIIIISLVYLVFLQDYRTLGNRPAVKLERLKEYLQETFVTAKNIKVVCSGEKCERCVVKADSNDTNVSLSLFKERPTVYWFDKDGIFGEYKYDDEAVCFSYQIYPNKSSTAIVLEKDGKYYLFHPYFQGCEVMDSLDDIKSKIFRKIE